MIDPEFSIRDDFPPVDYDAWRALAEASLRGAPFEKKLVTHLYEGIDLKPVYSSEDQLEEGDESGRLGFSPYVRGSSFSAATLTGWDLRQEHSLPDLSAANQAILEDLQGGVSSLLLVLDRAACFGLDPDDDQGEAFIGRGGLMVYHVDDLDTVLADVHCSKVGITVEAGAAFLPMAALLIALWRRRQLLPDEIHGAFNADPLAVLARAGELPVLVEDALMQMSDLAAWTSKNYPQVTAIGVDTGPYHEAGSTAAQDLAFAMATAVQYVRTMSDRGMDIDTAVCQILFQISLDTHHFLSIAKLRAARQLWARVVEVCGGTPAAGIMRIHARLGNRALTRYDPHVNLLRNTVGVFAAGIGGADAITSVPFDYAMGPSNDVSRRVARNTGLILQQESHLQRVIDPAGGSWFMEKLTNQLAAKAWEIFQQIERHGGMLLALQSGWVAEQVDSAFASRAKDIASCKVAITGVSQFPDLDESKIDHVASDPQKLRDHALRRVEAYRSQQVSWSKSSAASNRTARSDRTAEAVEAAMGGATLGQLAESLGFHGQTTRIKPLRALSLAEPFEELRDLSDAWRANHGKRPSVFLANMGPIAQHTGRANYSKNFFEAGGFEVISGEAFQEADAAALAFAESGASIGVICSSDKLYPKYVPDVAPKLKAAGARTVVLAGKPGSHEEDWRAAGVDRFIYVSCDMLASLQGMLAEEGVLTS